MAQWAADSCDLGQGGSMWRTLEQLQADGSFDAAELEFAAHEEFASQLGSFLLAHGYCTGQLPAQLSTAAPLTVELAQSPYLIGLRCPTASVCYAAGGGVVVSTTDGGRNWAVHTVIAKTHNAYSDIGGFFAHRLPDGLGMLRSHNHRWGSWVPGQDYKRLAHLGQGGAFQAVPTPVLYCLPFGEHLFRRVTGGSGCRLCDDQWWPVLGVGGASTPQQ